MMIEILSLLGKVDPVSRHPPGHLPVSLAGQSVPHPPQSRGEEVVQLLCVTNTRQSGPVNHPTSDGVDDKLDGQLAVISIIKSQQGLFTDNDSITWPTVSADQQTSTPRRKQT